MNKKILVIIPIIIIIVLIAYSQNLQPEEDKKKSVSDYSEYELREIKEKYAKGYFLELYLPEDLGSGKCKVVAPNIMEIVLQPDFIRSEEFAQQLNLDRKLSTIIIPCDAISSKVSQLTMNYLTEESPIDATKYQWWITPYPLDDVREKVFFSEQTLEPYVITGKNKVVVIDPIFTGSAYQNGFYEFWAGRCDESCLNVPIYFDYLLIPDAAYGKSSNAVNIFNQLNYPIITDYDFGLNPELIFEYNTVIMLHSEYVTKDMFDAITQHPKVMYLYPNALEKEIGFNSTNIWLIAQTTNYTNNYFDWQYENTYPYEFDRECKNWQFREISQGVQLLCYPELLITEDLNLIKFINDFVFS